MKKSNPKYLLSVIVTSFNQHLTLPQALDSILAQKCNFQFEIIIGDDASTDGSREICLDYQAKYPEIVKTNLSEVNQGVTANFISTVNLARGKYIAICAADDFWHNPDKLRLQLEFLDNHPDYGMVYTNYHKLNVRNNKITKNFLLSSQNKPVEGAGLSNLIFKGKVPILTVTVLFRKEIFDKCVPWEDFTYLNFPLEDWPTWIFLSIWSKVGYLPVSTATYRYGHVSLSNPDGYDQILNNMNGSCKMYNYISSLFPDEVADDDTAYRNYVNGNLLNLAYRKFDFPAAKKYAKALSETNAGSLKSDMAMIKPAFFTYALLKQLKSRLNS